MRKLTERASEHTSTHSVHTHEIHYQDCGCTVTVRCYSEAGARQERAWQEEQGRTVEVRQVSK